MDLSRFKWPLIIIAVAGVIWLLSEGGINYMHKQFTKSTPGVDLEKDKVDEKGLSRLGGFLIQTFRYEKAYAILTDAVERYPEGDDFLFNQYRLVKCAEKMGRYEEASNILLQLRDMNAHQYDERVPDPDVLGLRLDKLVETHEIGEVGSY